MGLLVIDLRRGEVVCRGGMAGGAYAGEGVEAVEQLHCLFW